MSEAPVIETVDLTRAFGSVQALRGLNLTAPKGVITGVLGRNGAGKTTAIKILLGMVRRHGGAARAFGLDPQNPKDGIEIRRRTGAVLEDKDLYPEFTVARMIAFTASLYPTWRRDLANRYLDRFGLSPKARVRTLSRGTRSKLALLLALCRGAELLILDEPTSDLDPAAREDVLQAIVGHVAEEGLSVLFSSHHLAEVEQVADRVVIVDRGRAVAEGPLDELQQSFRRVRLVFEGEAPQVALASPVVLRTSTSGRALEIVARRDDPDLMAEARALGPIAVETEPLTLKDIFLETVRAEG